MLFVEPDENSFYGLLISGPPHKKPVDEDRIPQPFTLSCSAFPVPVVGSVSKHRMLAFIEAICLGIWMVELKMENIWANMAKYVTLFKIKYPTMFAGGQRR